MKTNLVLPCRNLHGTPAEELAELYSNARSTVRKLIECMEEASPNGRDYYPLGLTALSAAILDRAPIGAALDVLSQELLTLSVPEFQEDGAKTTGEVLPGVPDHPSILPAIHLNGTSAAELRRTAVGVFKASGECENVLRLVNPNARDYDSTESWMIARQQHLDRITLMRRVGGYFLIIAQGCK